jgi:hypothetical protein
MSRIALRDAVHEAPIDFDNERGHERARVGGGGTRTASAIAVGADLEAPGAALPDEARHGSRRLATCHHGETTEATVLDLRDGTLMLATLGMS